MKFLTKRIVVIFYFCALLTGLLFYFTGYAFSSKVLNVAIVIVIIIYPIIRFFLWRIPMWVKISSGLTVSALLVLALWDLPVLIAFSEETEHTIQSWKLHGKEVLLVKRQGWAGPPYLQYDLKDFKIFGLIVKTIAYGSPRFPS